jgi:hypothetical protein
MGIAAPLKLEGVPPETAADISRLLGELKRSLKNPSAERARSFAPSVPDAPGGPSLVQLLQQILKQGK